MTTVTKDSKLRTSSRHWARRIPSLSVIALAVGLAGCGDVGKTADEYIKSAQEHRLDGEMRAAVIDLKNALQKDPDSSAARFMLGEIYLDITDGASAEKELVRAQELGMGEGAIALPLARAWLLQGQNDRVLNDLPLPPEDNPQYVTVLVLHGQALLGQSNLDYAQETFEKALAVEPESLDGLVGLARVAMARGDLDKAAELQAKTMEVGPDAINSLLLKADLAFLKKDYAEAEDVFGTLVKLRPQNLQYRTSEAWAQLGAGEFETAAKSLDVIFRAAPNNSQIQYLRGVAYYNLANYTEARDMMSKVLAQNSDYAPALAIAGASSYALKEYEQARSHLSRLVGMAPNFEVGRKMLSMTQMQLGQQKAAAETLRPLMKDPDEIKDQQTLQLIATAALQSGDLKSGKNYIEKAVERAPDDASLRTQLGLVRINLGEIDEGLADLKEAADSSDSGRGEYMLAANQIKAGKFKEALETAAQLQEKLPDQSIGFVLEGMAKDKLGDEDGARAAFEKALEVNPKAVDAIHNLSLIDIRNGNLTGAKAILDDYLDANPDNVYILADAARLEARIGNADALESRLAHIVELRPNVAASRVYLARLYLMRDAPDKAVGLLEEVLQDNRDNSGLLEVLGRGQLALGRATSAVDTFAQLVKLQESSPAAQYWSAQAMEQAGDLAGAMTAVDRALSLAPKNTPVQLLKGDIAARMGDASTLRQVLQTLSSDQEVVSGDDYKDLQGSLAEIEGNYDEAIQINETLNAKNPSSDRIARLAALETRNDNAKAAIARLEAWIGANPDDVNRRIQLSGLYNDQGRYAESETLLTTLVEKQPDYWPGQNDLAWALYKQKKTDSAMTHVETALKLAPDNPLVLDTYGTILLEEGDPRKAVVYLERVVQRVPGMTSSQVTLAKSYMAIDRSDDARQLLERLLREHKTFPEKAEAQSLLANLQEPDQN